MNISRLLKVVAISIFAFSINASDTFGQTCSLSVETTIGESETPIKGATAIAINSASSKMYKSSFRQGYPFFAQLPEGEYSVTVKRAGYKQTVDQVDHECENAENGIAWAYLSMWKGSTTEKVNLTKDVVVMRENVKTIQGDSDVPSGVTYNAPASTSTGIAPKSVSGGVLNGRATSLPKPEYPPAARAVRAAGAVTVQVMVDTDGRVISVSAVSGHPLLRQAAENAARGATFEPVYLAGQAVKVSGVISYNFVP